MVRTQPNTLLLAALAWSSLAVAASAQVKVDKELPEYKSVRAVSGQVSSVGSDTMNNLMTLWGEGFKKQYPRVVLAVEGKGSATAPQALIEGTAAFGPMSRDMKASEIDAFEKKFGYKPTQLPVAIDMLAVYVHRDNPIKGLSLQQVDAIFSKTRKGGLPGEVRTWGDLGLDGEWKDKPISAYGRNSASGTYGYFKEHALFGGDFKDSVKEQPGSSSVVQSVGRDKYAIGYSGIGYLTSEVRAVPLAGQSSDEFVPADPDHAYTGDYPLSRRLLLSLNYKPGAQLDPLRREFVKYVYSQQGQQDVVKDGYYPVTARMAAAALKSIGAAPVGAKGK
ncbi:MAG: phosphate ABC transporter substrate-binding protein [Pirellulales bacterium]